LSWRLKLSNWLSGGILDKYEQQAKIAQSKLQQTELEIDRYQSQLQQSQKELQQTNAQLKIYRGLQDELGTNQIKLQKATTEFKSCQEKLTATQNELTELQTKLQTTSQQLAVSQNWLEQLKAPVKVTAINKILPKHEFDTLWGFGLGNPRVDSISSGGSLMFMGWVLGKKAVAKSVTITYNNEILVETPIDRPRPTVTQQYPDIPKAGTCGFECSLMVAGVPNEAELYLSVVLEDGSIIPLCGIVLQNDRSSVNSFGIDRC
jgi:multidrug efflux pump subunit AcrA (membrane-fusion protein)